MTSEPLPDEFGGYFQLDLPRKTELHSPAMGFQSARAAFRWLVESVRPQRIWMPAFICDSMLEVFAAASVRCEFYNVDSQFHPRLPANLSSGDILLFVNYFGLCRQHVDHLLRRFPAEQLVIDNSQAFFEPPSPCLGTLYSPRKFVGVADGGYLYASGVTCPPPEEEDRGSLARSEHLLIRAACGAQAGYARYCDAEKTLMADVPRRMSRWTQRLLGSLDYDSIARSRRANFDAVHATLGQLNRLQVPGGGDTVPMCYPLVLGQDCSRQKKCLHEMRIFVPTYWQDCLPRLPESAEERAFACRTVYVPIDQRLSTEQAAKVAKLVFDVVKT